MGTEWAMIESQNTNFDNQKDAKEAYYFVHQAFDVRFNSRDVNNNVVVDITRHGCNNGVGFIQRSGNFEADIHICEVWTCNEPCVRCHIFRKVLQNK